MSTIDEIEALLARATSGPWEHHVEVLPPSGLGLLPPESPAQVAHLVRTAWIHGQAKAKVQIVHQWYSPYTNPNHFHDFDEADASLIVALRNSAPDLIAVVRAAAKVATPNGMHLTTEAWGALEEALAKLGVRP